MRRITNMLAGLTSLAVGLALTLSTASAAEQAPFKADYAGSFAFTSASTGAMTGAGVASHLGNASVAGTLVVTGQTGSCYTRTMQLTQTAANGDELEVSVDDVFCFTTPTSSQGSGTYTITGGTGRFAGATGSGVEHCKGDFTTNRFELSLVGKASHPTGG